jgi:hypothetical protein
VARKQLDETLKLIRRIEFEKAISVGEQEKISKKIIELIKTDSVPMDADYAGPTPSYDEPSGRYRPTKEFVEGMIQLFKDGGKLPKRLCWEVVLGCKDAVESELSLVETVVEKGVVCDVVGDTHGVSVRASSGRIDDDVDHLRRRSPAILRPMQPPVDDWRTLGRPHDRFQRRLCGSRILVRRGRAHAVRL